MHKLKKYHASLNRSSINQFHFAEDIKLVCIDFMVHYNF